MTDLHALVASGATLDEVAAALGVSRRTASRRLAAAGLSLAGRGVGRPRGADVPRTETITVRLTPAELEYVDAQAVTADCSIGELVRRRLGLS